MTDLNQIADELAESILHRLPLAEAAIEHGEDGEFAVSVHQGDDTWRILLHREYAYPDASAVIVTYVMDPDGDAIKDLFDTPEDAADYLVSQLLPSPAPVA